MRLALIIIVVISIWPSTSLIGQSIDYLTTVILVRHAERDDGVDTLNSAGLERAQELQRMLKDANVQAIYTSSFYRAQETAQPLADALHLELNIYDPNKLNELVYLITDKHKGETVLVTGHSNVTPMTVNALGVSPSIPNLEHHVYDQMYIVTFSKHRTPKLVTLEYGKQSH
jgi:2,3-bisphosphoglycerate-dependent phosphoglycerate mutase